MFLKIIIISLTFPNSPICFGWCRSCISKRLLMCMQIEWELEQALCLTEVSKGHMSGFSSVAGLDATHRKPQTQLLPWLLQSLHPLNTSHFFQLCSKTSMKAFVSYHPTSSRSVPVPSPYKKGSNWFSNSQTSSRNQANLFIKRNFSGSKSMIVQSIICWGFYRSPLHTFLTRIMWELKLLVNTNQARRNMICFLF